MSAAEVIADFVLEAATRDGLECLLADTIRALVARKALPCASSLVVSLLAEDIARIASPWMWIDNDEYPLGEWCERLAPVAGRMRSVGAIRRMFERGQVSWQAITLERNAANGFPTSLVELGEFPDWEHAALVVDKHLRACGWGLLGEARPTPPPDPWLEDYDPTPF